MQVISRLSMMRKWQIAALNWGPRTQPNYIFIFIYLSLFIYWLDKYLYIGWALETQFRAAISATVRANDAGFKCT